MKTPRNCKCKKPNLDGIPRVGEHEGAFMICLNCKGRVWDFTSKDMNKPKEEKKWEIEQAIKRCNQWCWEEKEAQREEIIERVKKYSKQYHGGGNGRRLFIQLLGELENL